MLTGSTQASMFEFVLFKVHIVVLFSLVFAYQVPCKSDRYLTMHELISTKTETLELVQDIFENATDDDDENFDCICLLTESNDIDVIRYIFSKSVYMDAPERPASVRAILKSKLAHCKTALTPEDPAYAVVLLCLEEIQYDFRRHLDYVLDNDLLDLIMDGNLTLVKSLSQLASSFLHIFRLTYKRSRTTLSRPSISLLKMALI